MKTIEIEIGGTTPLLMSKFGAEAEMQVSQGTAKVFRKGDKTPREEALERAYVDTDGNMYLPGMNIFRSFIDAGIYIKNGRKNFTTSKSSLIPSFMEITPDSLVCPVLIDGKHTKTFEVDTRSVVNPATNMRNIRHRPLFPKWAVKIKVAYNDLEITDKTVREIIDIAGQKIGLGDFRPSRKGIYGKFVVTNWKVLA